MQGVSLVHGKCVVVKAVNSKNKTIPEEHFKEIYGKIPNRNI